jgi:hypothetical protein
MTDHQSCSPANAQDFDAMCDLFTGHASVVANWKHSYFGAAYSTRLKAAIAEMKYAIAEAEKHPEIRPDAAATPKATADERWCLANNISCNDPTVAQTSEARLSEEERHAIEHARYQVGQASIVNLDCYLVKDLIRALDRAYPLSSAESK